MIVYMFFMFDDIYVCMCVRVRVRVSVRMYVCMYV